MTQTKPETKNSSETSDEKTYAKFLEDRQAAIDAENDDDEIEDRAEYRSGFDNPPAPRATDGGKPGTKEVPVLKKAETLEKAAHANKQEIRKAEKAAREASRRPTVSDTKAK